MLIGATILCVLVLLTLLAERASARVWQGERVTPMYRCPACDLHYPEAAVAASGTRRCPAGHLVVATAQHSGGGASMIAIFACLGFLAVALVILLGAGGNG